MAKRNYLVEGLSGAGKSSVYEELIRRGYKAISTDRAWKHPDPPGAPMHSMWNRNRAVSELERPEPDVLFVCGSSRNRDDFLPHFTKIFNLRIDDDTMRRRLQERTNNDFGKHPEELELMLALNRSDAKPAGAIHVDATRPLEQVVEEVLRLADCPTVASYSTLLPWSTSGAVTGHSFVIPMSVFPIVEDAAGDIREILSRESIARLEYAWSGSVLATLLQYLAEQGIDLMHSDHDQLASEISRIGGDSVVVLTSEQRERYVARLDPSAFEGTVLRRYYERVSNTAADGVEYAMLDGIAFFRDTLEALESATLAAVIIGARSSS